MASSCCSAAAFLWWPVGAALCSVSGALGFDACVLLWRCDFVASWSWLFSWHSSGTWHSSSTSLLVNSHHYWVEFAFEFLLLSVHGVGISIGVSFEPLETLSGPVFDVLLLFIGELSLQFLLVKSVLHLEAVVLKSVFGFDLLGHQFILSLVLL